MNQKRQLLTLAGLLGLAAACAVLWLLLRGGGHSTDNAPVPDPVPVYTAQSEAMDIAIENSFGSYNIVLQYGEGGGVYRVSQYSSEIPMNTGRLTYLGEGANTLTATDHFDSRANLGQFGLDSPAASAKITFADGTVTTLYVGILSPDAETVYLMADGDNLAADPLAVYLVPLDHIDHILLGATDLISPIVTGSYPAGGYFDTAVLSGNLRQSPITVAKQGDGSYTVAQSGVQHPVHPYGGLSSVLSVYGTTADEVVAVHPTGEMLASYGLAAPYSTILLQSGQETLELWASEPDADGLCYLYRTGNPVIYRIPASRLYWLELDAFRLSDPTIVNPPPVLEELAGIQITIADEVHTIRFSHNEQADPHAWLDDAQLPMELLRPFVQTLLSPQAVSFGQPHAGSATLLLDVTFRFTDGSNGTYRYSIGDAGQVYATDSNGAVYVVQEAYVQKVISDFYAVANGQAVTPWS